MRLSRVEIEGYRSISNAVTLHLDPAVTIILGANDHGKSNLLEALTHLNEDKAFDLERDLNWDHANSPEKFPALTFTFSLDDGDKTALLTLAEELRAAETAGAAPPASAAPTVPASPPSSPAPTPPPEPQPPAVPEPATGPSDAQPTPGPPQPKPLTVADMPSTLEVKRVGVQGKRLCTALLGLPKGSATRFLKEHGPRVELTPIRK